MGDHVVHRADRHRVAGRLFRGVALHLPAAVWGVHRTHQGPVRRPAQARPIPVHVCTEHGQHEAMLLIGAPQ